MHVSELDTPALLIDLDIFERNLSRVADYAKANDLRLRPHTKTHKVPAVGKLQIESGAVGLTVAKVGEAEVMLASGTPDLLVAYPIIGRSKLERLTEVARKTRVTVALDSSFAARQLSEAARQAQVNFGVLAEVDVGLGRVGVTPERNCCNWRRLSGGCPGSRSRASRSIPVTSRCWARTVRRKHYGNWGARFARCWTISAGPVLRFAL